MNFQNRREFITDLIDIGVKFDQNLHIDSDEAARWVKLTPAEPLPFTAASFGHYPFDKDERKAQKLERLLERVMDEPSLDDMADLRDMIREMVITIARDEVVTTGIALSRELDITPIPLRADNGREAMFLESMR